MKEVIEEYTFIEDVFDTKEKKNQDKYEYYIDGIQSALHKKKIGTEDWYEFVVKEKDGELTKKWMKRKVDPKKLEKITDIEIVLKYINDMYDDIMFNDGNKEVKIEDYIKK